MRGRRYSIFDIRYLIFDPIYLVLFRYDKLVLPYERQGTCTLRSYCNSVQHTAVVMDSNNNK